MTELRYIVDDKGTVLEVDYWTRKEWERCGPNDELITKHYYIQRKDRSKYHQHPIVYEGPAYLTVAAAIEAFKNRINNQISEIEQRIRELEEKIKQLQILINI